VFKIRVVRKMSGAKRDEVTGDWRKLHNVELHGLYCSQKNIPVIKSRLRRWAGRVARIGRGKVGKPDGRGPLIHDLEDKRRWENNIKKDL
jgi:hypothetical protein